MNWIPFFGGNVDGAVFCSETYPAKCSGQVKGILKNPLFEPNCIYFLRKKNPDDFEIDVNCNEGAFFTKLQRNACGPALEVSKREIILNKVIIVVFIYDY